MRIDNICNNCTVSNFAEEQEVWAQDWSVPGVSGGDIAVQHGAIAAIFQDEIVPVVIQAGDGRPDAIDQSGGRRRREALV